MKTISCVYLRQLEGNGIWLGEEPIAIEAECEQFGDSVLTIWTTETLDRLAALELDADELTGCTEAIEEKFFEGEREACRFSKVQQQLGMAAE